MSATPSDVLRMYSQALRVAAPREWETFVECFDAYATDVTVAVTNAEQHEILVAQGRAKAFLHLLNLFRNCHTQPKPPNNPTP